MTKVLEDMRLSYRNGYLQALSDYAWWIDGVQYVGSCGKTLGEATKEFLEDDGLGKVEVKDDLT